MQTRSEPPNVWWALGSKGLAELTEADSARGFGDFGYRLDNFLAQLAIIFHPMTIALTGDIIHAH
jgi:hypothetical protein